jgi:hypothetical protein
MKRQLCKKGSEFRTLILFSLFPTHKKTSEFSTQGVPISFELERLNIGGAMNGTTGKFKAPRKGFYFLFLCL